MNSLWLSSPPFSIFFPRSVLVKVPCTSKGNTKLFCGQQAQVEEGLEQAGRGGCRLKRAVLPTGEAPLRGMNSTQFHTLREAQPIKIKTTKHAAALVNSNWGFIQQRTWPWLCDQAEGVDPFKYSFESLLHTLITPWTLRFHPNWPAFLLREFSGVLYTGWR